MLVAQLKRWDGYKFIPVPIDKVKGQSILSYMNSSEDVLVAAMIEDGKAVLSVSNDKEQVEKHKRRMLSFHCKDLLMLMGTEVVPIIYIDVFPDSTFIKHTVPAEEENDGRQWW